MLQASRRIGELLVERKVLSRDDLAQFLAREETEGIPLASLLAREGIVAERDLLAVVAIEAGHEFVDLSTTFANEAATGALPAEVAWEYRALPVDIGSDHILVAMADPTDRASVDAVQAAVGLPVRTALAHRADLESALRQVYGPRPNSAPAAEPSAESNFSAVIDFEPNSELHLDTLLERVVELHGSDLHLTAGLPPCARIDGSVTPMGDLPELNGSEIRRMLYGVLTQRQRERFEAELELDASYSIPNVGRFRVNVFLQRDSVGAVMRVIPNQVVDFDKLGLPPIVADLADNPRGLVLVTGPTGSGKSTTLAAMIDRINSSKAVHIMTVEDPIEFLHTHRASIVNQREVGEDTKSFAQALRHVLRQDPDVILVGELRDLETVSAALTAAETGHLVFGTLHTQDAPQSIDRIIDVFPASQQSQVRAQLAGTIQGIVTQQLIPLATGRGRAVAAEVLVSTPAVRNLIREGKTYQIYSAMQGGRQFGMQTMDYSLSVLVKQRRITMATALERCASGDELRRLVESSAA